MPGEKNFALPIDSGIGTPILGTKPARTPDDRGRAREMGMERKTEGQAERNAQRMPTPECKGLVFWPIPKFSDLELGFGAREESFFNRRDLPEVPRQHRDAAMALFYSGGKLPEFDPRVDRILAMRAVKAWLGSWAPAHESKEATVGYAFWLWSTPEALGAAKKEAR